MLAQGKLAIATRQAARSHPGPDHGAVRALGQRIRQGFGVARRGQHRCSHRTGGAGVGCCGKSCFGRPSESYKVEQHRERFLTREEFSRFGAAISAAPGEDLDSAHAAAAVRLLVLTGYRRNEILGPHWGDHDCKSGEMLIARSKTGPQMVPMPSSAAEVLGGLSSTPRPYGTTESGQRADGPSPLTRPRSAPSAGQHVGTPIPDLVDHPWLQKTFFTSHRTCTSPYSPPTGPPIRYCYE